MLRRGIRGGGWASSLVLAENKKQGERQMASKHIFVTGGVVSGLGKGISAASLGRLLKQRGLKVAAQKLDPYVNVDPGTMSPYQHGEPVPAWRGVRHRGRRGD